MLENLSCRACGGAGEQGSKTGDRTTCSACDGMGVDPGLLNERYEEQRRKGRRDALEALRVFLDLLGR